MNSTWSKNCVNISNTSCASLFSLALPLVSFSKLPWTLSVTNRARIHQRTTFELTTFFWDSPMVSTRWYNNHFGGTSYAPPLLTFLCCNIYHFWVFYAIFRLKDIFLRLFFFSRIKYPFYIYPNFVCTIKSKNCFILVTVSPSYFHFCNHTPYFLHDFRSIDKVHIPL